MPRCGLRFRVVDGNGYFAPVVFDGPRADGETVRVWSKAGRIPDSKLRLIALQTGCRISWLRDGEGPQYDRNPGLVVSEPVSTYDALSPRERALLDNYRALDEAAKSTLEQTGALFAQQAAAGSRRRSGQR